MLSTKLENKKPTNCAIYRNIYLSYIFVYCMYNMFHFNMKSIQLELHKCFNFY